MPAAIVDAGPVVALFGVGRQAYREKYRKLFAQAAAESWSLLTTWPCITEASYLLDVPQRFSMLKWVAAGAVTVYSFDQSELEDIVTAMIQYTARPRTEMDLADASLLWLAAQCDVARVITLDVRDFSRYQLPDGRSFEIL